MGTASFLCCAHVDVKSRQHVNQCSVSHFHFIVYRNKKKITSKRIPADAPCSQPDSYTSSSPKLQTLHSFPPRQPGLTSSNLVCQQGKEKVMPRGNFLCVSPLVFMKSARQSATYSNSCRGEKAQDPGYSAATHRQGPRAPQSPAPYLCAVPADNFIGCWVELTLHLDLLFPLFRDLHLQHSKLRSSKIQGKKLPIFY